MRLIVQAWLEGEWKAISAPPEGEVAVITDRQPGGGEDVYIAQIDPEARKGVILKTILGMVMEEELTALDAEVVTTLEPGMAYEMETHPNEDLIPVQLRVCVVEDPPTP